MAYRDSHLGVDQIETDTARSLRETITAAQRALELLEADAYESAYGAVKNATTHAKLAMRRIEHLHLIVDMGIDVPETLMQQ